MGMALATFTRNLARNSTCVNVFIEFANLVTKTMDLYSYLSDLSNSLDLQIFCLFVFTSPKKKVARFDCGSFKNATPGNLSLKDYFN